MRKNIKRKNNILNFITGCAMGSILVGVNLLNWTGPYQQVNFKIAAVIMIVAGVLWLVPFVLVNRKVLFKKY